MMPTLADDCAALFLSQAQFLPTKYLHRLIGAQPRHERRRVAAADEHDITIGRHLGKCDSNYLVKHRLHRDFMISIEHHRKWRAEMCVQRLKIAACEC